MYINIDFMVDDDQTPEQALKGMLEGYSGLTGKVIQQVGPTGWPQAQVSGTTDAVVVFADAYGYEV